MNKRKSKGSKTSLTGSLTSLQMAKLKVARNDYGFSKFLTSDGEIMMMKEDKFCGWFILLILE